MRVSRGLMALSVCLVASVAAAQGEPEGEPGETAEPAEPAEPAQPAEPPPKDDAEAEKERKLQEAKLLFRQGNALRKVGDFQRAFALYQRSRELLPSLPNTMNAAFCLEQLDRNAEALELYEVLLTDFSQDLASDMRAAIADSVRKLRPLVGSLEASANVTGVLVIDGRTRGTLPLRTPIRVMPGEHTVRIIKDGYETFEKQVTVKAQESVAVDARLRPLAASGRLRVEDPANEGADLYVDGALVGKLPWEGTLAPGKHLYWVRKDDKGTAPTLATVVQGQTVLASARSAPLSRELRIVVDPPSAEFLINGVPVGSGMWHGRLPVGKLVVEAREEGYHPGRQEETLGATTSGDIAVKLRVDAAHPRWIKPEQSRIYAEVFAGFALGPSLNSGAEEFCDSGACADNGMALGTIAGLRGGYEFPFRLALEVSIGFMYLSKTLSRTASATYSAPPISAEYTFDDKLRLSGPLASVGVAYRHPLSEQFAVDGRLELGAVLASAQDRVDASASARGETVEATVTRSGESKSSAAPFAMPSAFFRVNFGAFHGAVGVLVPIFLVEGPDNTHGETVVSGCDPVGDPLSVRCARGQDTVAEERSYGRFILVIPTLAAGYTF